MYRALYSVTVLHITNKVQKVKLSGTGCPAVSEPDRTEPNSGL